MATQEGAASQWMGGRLVHTNPSACRENLARRAERLEAREKAIGLVPPS
jgi:hypothetical protein